MPTRRMFSFLIVASLVLFQPCGFVSAAEQGDAGDHSKQPWIGPKADRNQDGKIDETEASQAKEAWMKLHPRKEKMLEHADANGDGKIDETEKQQAKEEWKESHPRPEGEDRDGKGPKWDKDNNPPGPKGGAGTNWENPAGPVGGPGQSPDHKMGNAPQQGERRGPPWMTKGGQRPSGGNGGGQGQPAKKK